MACFTQCSCLILSLNFMTDDVDNEKKSVYIANFEGQCTEVIWDMILIASKSFKKVS